MAELVRREKKQEKQPRHQAPVRPVGEIGAEKERPRYPAMAHLTGVESEMPKAKDSKTPEG